MSDIPNNLRQPQGKDFPYFRRLRNRIVVILLAASFIPLALIGGGMYYYSASLLKQKTLESLRLEVLKHKETIDRFLTERTMYLKILSQNISPTRLTRPGVLESVFQSLQKELPCFTDLGVIDDQGRHLSYVGPYNLISKNYKDTAWFKAVKTRGVFISDVFLGHRNVPHFIIAVKHTGDDGIWFMRATINAEYFDSIVSRVANKKNEDAFLINNKGIFQTNPRITGKLMEQSECTNPERFEGVRLDKYHGLLRATVWLESVPWLCMVQIDPDKAFAELHRIRNYGALVIILGAILIVFTVFPTTNYIIFQMEINRRSLSYLDEQLRYTSKISSMLALSSSLVREIKDTLANIDIVAIWIQDLIKKNLSCQDNIHEINESLSQINNEVLRGRKAVDKFSNISPTTGSAIMEVSVNAILDDLIDLLSRELNFINIRIKRDYQDNIPLIRCDPSRLRQVFQNLILNAMSAIQRDGAITLKTRAGLDNVTVTVTDDGPGIPEKDIEKIFDPLFTTRAEEMGIGLPVCLNILEKSGGDLSVASELGKGTSFTVTLPFKFKISG